MFLSSLNTGPLKLLSVCFLLLFAACGNGDNGTLPGYVEGEYTYLASPVGGRLERLHVRRGDRVTGGAVLYSLEGNPEKAALEQARSRLEQARHRLEDLAKGQRPSEIRAIQAKISQARTNLELSRVEYERRKKLFADQTIPKEDLERYRTRYRADDAGLKELLAQLETARLGGREDALRAAESEVASMEAEVSRASWTLERKTGTAPGTGVVFDTYFTVGEWIPQGKPVVSLLLPENVRLRFFVPEPVLSGIELGRSISFSSDGCPETLRATISYISPEAEYTPPVIYSKQSRSKLVFMVEATPDDSLDIRVLHPGMPVDVRLALNGNGE
jgi:HlyD family secretion protein